MHVALRLLKDYQEKVEAEGELSEDELPPEVLNQVQENLTHDRRHFAVSITRSGPVDCSQLHSAGCAACSSACSREFFSCACMRPWTCTHARLLHILSMIAEVVGKMCCALDSLAVSPCPGPEPAWH